MRQLEKIFKALSDRNRIRIIKMLETKPLCVCEITAILKLATSTVSKHLSLLREAGFIIDEKDGKWINYQLSKKGKNLYTSELLEFISNWLTDDKVVKSDKKNIQSVNRADLCKKENEV